MHSARVISGALGKQNPTRPFQRTLLLLCFACLPSLLPLTVHLDLRATDCDCALLVRYSMRSPIRPAVARPTDQEKDG